MARTHSGREYVEAARKNGLEVKTGKGDHMNIYGPAGRGYMTVPMQKELAKGTDCAIRKWFRALGILVVMMVVSFAILIPVLGI